jgi:hypothetical protein
MTSKELLQQSLNHKQPERIVFDMGSNAVTGIHVKALENLRNFYGLERRPVRVIEPYQMLGLVEPDLMDAIGIDVMGIWGEDNLLGYNNNPPLKLFKTFWGQELLVPEKFSTKKDANGDLLSFPNGDESIAPSAKMPISSYFFDAIERQDIIDDSNLNVQDNLEEFSPITEQSLAYWKTETMKAQATGKGVMASFGGTGLGDIALVPGMQLKHPKGIRSISEWYMSTIMRNEYVHEIFDRQSELAIENLTKIFASVGNNIDVVFLCGTDFGTQNSTFCAPEQFDDLWMPYYRRINDWIHTNTSWKTFKHSCGAVESFMGRFIDAGFDIINPVQINASGMDPKHLKETYGQHLTFWGGGVDTQITLPSKSPEKVREEVLRLCEIFGKDGGFVFNTVHNIQADVPVMNIVAMIDAIREFNT